MWPSECQFIISTGTLQALFIGPLTLDLNEEQFKKFVVNFHQTDNHEMLVSKLLTWYHLLNNIFLILCNAYFHVVGFLFNDEFTWLKGVGLFTIMVGVSYSIGTSKSSILRKQLWYCFVVFFKSLIIMQNETNTL